MDNDIFSTRNYCINKILLRTLGIWPDQPLIVRILLPSFFILSNMSLIIPELRRLTVIWGDIDQTMEITFSVILLAGTIIMTINSATKNTELRDLVGQIRSNWQSFSKNPPIVTILEKYASEACRKTIVHTFAMYSSSVAFVLLPLTPIILDVVLPLNESRPKKFMYNVDYGFDRDQYYYSILFHSMIPTYTCMTILAAIDSVFAVWVQHCCALFEIAGYYLKRETGGLDIHSVDNEISQSRHEMAFANVCLCIKQHQNAMLFADLIERTYSTVTAIVIGISMILMSISGLLLVIQANSFEDACRYLTVGLVILYHLHHHTVSGQKLINHSSQISRYAYNCDWYDFSLETRKLLMLIIARAQKPCLLTAGKVYIINMENFSEVVKTSVSYFTVLSSFRE